MSDRVDIKADDSFERRFGGIARLYGRTALETFRQSHICVIGVGGVGSWAAEALGRSAVGHITLIDLDDICVSNTNRQLPALDGNFGRMKVVALAERLRAINPACKVDVIEDFIGPDNFAEYLDRGYHFVIDAIDSVKTKAALINECRHRKIPIIMAGGAGGQTDPTCIRIDDLARTTQDPLASKVRAMLRRDYGFPRGEHKMRVNCVYSTETLIYPQVDGSVCAQKPVSDGPVRLDCDGGFGASVCVTGAFGFAAASHVLKILSRKL